jgi:hypothetical protein
LSFRRHRTVNSIYPDLLFGQEPVKIVDTGNRLLPVSDNHIAFSEAGAIGGAIGFQRDHQNTARDCEAVEQHLTAMEHNILSGNTDMAAPVLAVS